MAEPRVIKPAEFLRSGYNGSGADISAYRILTGDGANGQDAVDVQATSAGTILGSSCEAIADGTWGTYQVGGLAKIEAGAAVAVDALIMPTTGGKGITRTGTNSIFGMAKTAAAADGDIIEVELLIQQGA